jgi:cell fate (sporulation/competence/biofilm development) regulator YlbF (YheA/YmcA/DUF963 family)
MLKTNKWEKILTDDEYNFAEKLTDIIIDSDMPFIQVKNVINQITEYEEVEELIESFRYKLIKNKG